MTEANPFPESLLDIAKEQSASAAQREKDLKAQAEEAARLHKLWENLTSYLSRGWPLHVLELLDKEKPLLEKMRADNPSDIPSLDEIYRLAQEQAEDIKRFFPTYLEKACLVANLPLDRESRHPHYKFENGFFQLDIDDKKRTARLSDYESPKLYDFSADIEAIIEVVQREQKRVFGRQFDGKKFLKKLRSQYLAVLKKEKLSDGSTIPIRHITRRLGKNETGFRTDEFLIDLSKLIEQNLTETEGFRLDLQQTKDTSQGMFLHIETKRYVGLISFKKV